MTLASAIAGAFFIKRLYFIKLIYKLIKIFRLESVIDTENFAGVVEFINHGGTADGIAFIGINKHFGIFSRHVHADFVQEFFVEFGESFVSAKHIREILNIVMPDNNIAAAAVESLPEHFAVGI